MRQLLIGFALACASALGQSPEFTWMAPSDSRLEVLRTADLMVMFARWLELPDEQMKRDYRGAGGAISLLPI